jgi:glycosyltransferase involved in cell wall biosynthesis
MVCENNTVTVVVPCYNSERYIARCIKSILKQTVKPSQIIVVDDGSSDRTVQIAKRFPIEIVQHGYNKGLAEARNTGIREAKGDIIFFVDSDCEMYPNDIEYALKDFQEYQVDAICGQEIVIDAKTIVDKYRAHFPQSWGSIKIIDPHFLWGLCSAFKRESLLKVGLFSPIFKTNGEDVDISLRMKKMGYRLLYDPRIKVNHLRTDNILSLLKSTYRANYFGKLAYIKNLACQANREQEVVKALVNDVKARIVIPTIKQDISWNGWIYFSILGSLCFIVSKLATFRARLTASRRALRRLTNEDPYR